MNTSPDGKFSVTPCRFQDGQGDHSFTCPIHPVSLAALRHRPVVEFLHAVAGDPQARLVTIAIVGKVGTAFSEVLDKLVQRRTASDFLVLAVLGEEGQGSVQAAFPEMAKHLLAHLIPMPSAA